MSFDLQPILVSKRALRAKLAALPIAEKLQLLDELRDREVTLRRARSRLASNLSCLSEIVSTCTAASPYCASRIFSAPCSRSSSWARNSGLRAMSRSTVRR